MKAFLIAHIAPLARLQQRYWHWRSSRRDSQAFANSGAYWESRYAQGGNSGVGSYALFAEFKAEVLNAFVARQGVVQVMEFGCGDGNQLSLARYPQYLGFDISHSAVAACCKKFAADSSKRFRHVSEYQAETADLVLSLDVIYHLVEDEVFERYMRQLFSASHRFVIIYSSNFAQAPGSAEPHVKHREFLAWVRANEPGWRLLEHIPNRYPYQGDYRTGSPADFFVFEKPGTLAELGAAPAPQATSSL